MEQARRWLLAHAHESISIRRLADELHMSESRLRRSFRQAWGGSPQDFHTRARMALALRHLQAGCRVTETAWRVGYGQARCLKDCEQILRPQPRPAESAPPSA